MVASQIRNLSFVLLFTFLTIPIVSAHVTVKPREVGVSSWQTFTVSVPVEKDIATTNVRLALPAGLNHVTPTVKNGWEIEVKKTGTSEEAQASEIVWKNGSIPVGMRDEFTFSAQVPATTSVLSWKAYQTSADGSVVAWDQDPNAEGHDEDFSKTGPYSTTNVVNDLDVSSSLSWELCLALILSTVAIVLSVFSLTRSYRK